MKNAQFPPGPGNVIQLMSKSMMDIHFLMSEASAFLKPDKAVNEPAMQDNIGQRVAACDNECKNIRS